MERDIKSLKTKELENKRTWLQLTDEEIKNLSVKSACMYSRKGKSTVTIM